MRTECACAPEVGDDDVMMMSLSHIRQQEHQWSDRPTVHGIFCVWREWRPHENQGTTEVRSSNGLPGATRNRESIKLPRSSWCHKEP